MALPFASLNLYINPDFPQWLIFFIGPLQIISRFTISFFSHSSQAYLIAPFYTSWFVTYLFCRKFQERTTPIVSKHESEPKLHKWIKNIHRKFEGYAKYCGWWGRGENFYDTKRITLERRAFWAVSITEVPMKRDVNNRLHGPVSFLSCLPPLSSRLSNPPQASSR